MSRRLTWWTGLGTTLALVVGLSVSVGSQVWLRLDQSEKALAQEAEAAAQALAQRLEEVEVESHVIAVSPVVTNSLSDSAGREEYLVPTLRDRPIQARYRAIATVCDIRGQVVGSADPAALAARVRTSPHPRCGAPADLAAVLATGQGRTVLQAGGDRGQEFVFIDPIRLPITGTVEGALVVQVSVNHLLHPVIGMDLGEVTLVEVQPGQESPGFIDTPVALSRRFDTGLGPLVLRVPRESPLAGVQLKWMLAGHLLLVVLLAIPVTWIAAWLGRRMAEPVMALGELAQSPVGAQPQAWSALAARPDEVGQAAGRLQALTQQLQDQVEHLRHAQRGAEAANRAKSDFLAAMSHEIRTPLNAVIGLTALAADSQGAAQRDLMSQAQRSAGHLLALVNRVLDMARIESGRLEIEHRPASLMSILATTRSHVEAAARAKGLALSFETSAAVPGTLVCDETLLTEVLTNLVANAVKFTSHGAVRVRLAVEVAAPEGDERLVIEVEDTGIGIAAEHQNRIFEPFTQLDVGSAREYGGTGLGLALSRRIVELMHGHLSVRSRPAQGSTFRVDLPLLRAAGEAVPDVSADAEAGRGSDLPELERTVRRYVADRAVLVVDDDDVNGLLARLMLEQCGLKALHASDGATALGLLEGPTRFALVLMDCHLPVMDGFEITRRLRSLPGLQSLPVIACTADVLTESLESCLAAGMDDYVSKPFERSTLLAAMARCLQRAQSHSTRPML